MRIRCLSHYAGAHALVGKGKTQLATRSRPRFLSGRKRYTSSLYGEGLFLYGSAIETFFFSSLAIRCLGTAGRPLSEYSIRLLEGIGTISRTRTVASVSV